MRARLTVPTAGHKITTHIELILEVVVVVIPIAAE